MPPDLLLLIIARSAAASTDKGLKPAPTAAHSTAPSLSAMTLPLCPLPHIVFSDIKRTHPVLQVQLSQRAPLEQDTKNHMIFPILLEKLFLLGA